MIRIAIKDVIFKHNMKGNNTYMDKSKYEVIDTISIVTSNSHRQVQ